MTLSEKLQILKLARAHTRVALCARDAKAKARRLGDAVSSVDARVQAAEQRLVDYLDKLL